MSDFIDGVNEVIEAEQAEAAKLSEYWVDSDQPKRVTSRQIIARNDNNGVSLELVTFETEGNGTAFGCRAFSDLGSAITELYSRREIAEAWGRRLQVPIIKYTAPEAANPLKAYMVDPHGDAYIEGCVLCFAETVGRAKSFVMAAGPWADLEYTQLRAIRMPDYDKYAGSDRQIIETNEGLPEGAPAFFTVDEFI